MPRNISDLIEHRFGTPTTVGAQMPADGPLASILQRRTHRQYTGQPIEDELLEVLLACGLSASSKSDLQQASIVVVDDPDKQALIGSWIPSMPWITKAARFLVSAVITVAFELPLTRVTSRFQTTMWISS